MVEREVAGIDLRTYLRVLTHPLIALASSTLEITLEIEAELPEGAPDSRVRTVSENCRTLKFSGPVHEAQQSALGVALSIRGERLAGEAESRLRN